MERTTVTMCVSGPITGKRMVGKGTFEFLVHGMIFHLRSNTTYAKKINGASRAIVVYEVVANKKCSPKIVEVICNHTFQQVLQTNARYLD